MLYFHFSSSPPSPCTGSCPSLFTSGFKISDSVGSHVPVFISAPGLLCPCLYYCFYSPVILDYVEPNLLKRGFFQGHTLPCKLRVVVQTWNSSTWDAEARGLRVPGQPGLHSKTRLQINKYMHNIHTYILILLGFCIIWLLMVYNLF
jgi:hypothetical protein